MSTLRDYSSSRRTQRGIKSLDSYRVKSERTRLVDNMGTQEWTLIYQVPTADIKEQRENFTASLDNIHPNHKATDVYAPCIHTSSVDNDPDIQNGKLVTCVFRRPTEEMVLRPGRGVLRFGTYSTTLKKDVATFKERTPTSAAGDVVSAIYSLKREQKLEVVERGTKILRLADWAANEMTVYERADDWIGQGSVDGFTINEKKFDNLKCSRILIQRRPSNVAIVDSEWHFARKPEGWEQDGIIQEKWHAVEIPSGNEVDYDEDAIPRVTLTEGQSGYMAIRLYWHDSDVVTGFTDFTDVEDYFDWLE